VCWEGVAGGNLAAIAVTAAMARAVRRAAPLPCASIVSKGSRARVDCWGFGDSDPKLLEA
jgi:hypothetical protein